MNQLSCHFRSFSLNRASDETHLQEICFQFYIESHGLGYPIMRYVKTSPRRVWMSCTKLLLPIGLGFTLAAWLRINPRCRNFCWFLFSGLIFLHTDLSQLLGVELFFLTHKHVFPPEMFTKMTCDQCLFGLWKYEFWVCFIFYVCSLGKLTGQTCL